MTDSKPGESGLQRLVYSAAMKAKMQQGMQEAQADPLMQELLQSLRKASVESAARQAARELQTMGERAIDLQDLIAIVADDGSQSAYVFGPDGFSAVRSRDGRWSSPAPQMPVDALLVGHHRESGLIAKGLSIEARSA